MIEAEKQIIGCIILDDSCLYGIHNILKPEMFDGLFYRTVYESILSMYDMGKKISIVELSQAVENETFDQEFVNENLMQCVTECQSSALAKSYADTIIREYKARSVRKLFSTIGLKPNQIDDSIGEVMKRLEELSESHERRSRTMAEIVESCSDDYFKEKEESKIKLGFDNLDDCLGGLEGGDIIVVGARPSVGKSAFVTQVIAQVASQGYKVGYFNLEMNENQVYERFIAKAGMMSLNRIRRAKTFLDDEEQRFRLANKEVSKMRVVVSTGTKSVSEIKSECRHQKFDLIVIDYLQIIKSDRFYGNRVSEVGDISKAIKGLAMELHVPILLLSQLNRSLESREDKEPQMSDLRESGDIEQDASVIIMLWNLNDDENCKYKGIKVEKNRQGNKFKAGMQFDGDRMNFTESAKHFDDFKRDADKNSGFETYKTNDDNPFD